MAMGLFAAAHKAVLFFRTIKWCGRIYSGFSVRHDRQRIGALLEMQRPEKVADLLRFLEAITWMRTSLPNLVQTISLRRDLLEVHMHGNK